MCKLKLVKLDISCNRITIIPTLFRFLTTLTNLVLDNNPLQSPPAQVRFVNYSLLMLHGGIRKEIICCLTVACFVSFLSSCSELNAQKNVLCWGKFNPQSYYQWLTLYKPLSGLRWQCDEFGIWHLLFRSASLRIWQYC